MKRPTTAARTLTAALRDWYGLTRIEGLVAEGAPDVKVPVPPLVRGRLAAVERAWRACPDAGAVARAAEAAWREQYGRCPISGQRLPCAACSALEGNDEEVA